MVLAICPTDHCGPLSRVGVLAAGRPLLGGGIEESAGFFHGRKQHHRLLDIVSEVIAIVEALIVLGPVTAVGIDRGLRRAVNGQALPGAMVALSSDIAVWVLVTDISVTPIAAFTCSGLSSNPGSSRTTGRGIIDGVEVGDSALPLRTTSVAESRHSRRLRRRSRSAARQRRNRCFPRNARKQKGTRVPPVHAIEAVI